MNIQEIFEAVKKIGSLSFSTLDGETIHSRYAYFFSCDDDGLYFMTMNTKPFYRQLSASGKVAACGIYTSSTVTEMDEDGNPIMQPGYTLRITGDVREMAYKDVKLKAGTGDPGFGYIVEDIERYPAERVFCLYRGKGEIYDYDFEMMKRNYKLHRIRFSFGGMRHNEAGSRISEKCNGCGVCMDVCTFKAIAPGTPYRIKGVRCDECGNCILACPEKAILTSYTI